MKPVRQADLHLFEHDADEKLIGEVPRHPIGYLFILFNGLIVLTAILVGLFMAVRYQDNFLEMLPFSGVTDLTGVITTVAAIIVVLVVLGIAVGLYVYHGNYIVITDQKLVLVKQKNIFARSVSQLSIGDVQDVTVNQHSLLSRIFKYGSINIETAGEQANFSFPYGEYPHECAKAIVDAHENNLKIYGN